MKIVCPAKTAVLGIVSAWYILFDLSPPSCYPGCINALVRHWSPRFELTFVALGTIVDEMGLCTLLQWAWTTHKAHDRCNTTASGILCDCGIVIERRR